MCKHRNTAQRPFVSCSSLDTRVALSCLLNTFTQTQLQSKANFIFGHQGFIWFYRNCIVSVDWKETGVRLEYEYLPTNANTNGWSWVAGSHFTGQQPWKCYTITLSHVACCSWRKNMRVIQSLVLTRLYCQSNHSFTLNAAAQTFQSVIASRLPPSRWVEQIRDGSVEVWTPP